jgi:hypothetical protein
MIAKKVLKSIPPNFGKKVFEKSVNIKNTHHSS